MQRSKRQILTGLVATGVLGGALAAGGAVLASSPASATSAAATSAALAAGSGQTAGSASAASTTTTSAAVGVDGAHFLRVRGARLVLRTSASYLGLTPAELRAQLKAGKSLATLATEHGKTASGLDNAIVAAVTKRVDASKLTATRKAAVTGYANNHVAAFVAAPHPFEWAVKQLEQAAQAAGSTPAATPAAT
jgi:hypothetical protein